MIIARGDVVMVAQKGVYEGKPRPAVVVQADRLTDHDSIVVCLVTDAKGATAAPFRVPVKPSYANGLAKPSLIEADRIVTIRRKNIGKVVGTLEDPILGLLSTALGAFLGLR